MFWVQPAVVNQQVFIELNNLHCFLNDANHAKTDKQQYTLQYKII